MDRLPDASRAPLIAVEAAGPDARLTCGTCGKAVNVVNPDRGGRLDWFLTSHRCGPVRTAWQEGEPSAASIVADVMALLAELDQEDDHRPPVTDWPAFEAAEDDADAAILAIVAARWAAPEAGA